MDIERFNLLYFDSLKQTKSVEEITSLIVHIKSKYKGDKESFEYSRFLYRCLDHYHGIGNYFETLEIGHRLLYSEFYKQEEKLRQKALIYWKIGNSYVQLQEYGIALDYYLKALDIFKQLDKPKEVRSIKANIAMVYAEIQRYELAKETLLDLISASKTDNSKPTYSYTALARILLETNHPEQSKLYLDSAMFSAKLSKDNLEIAYIYRNMAWYHLKTLDFDSAEYYYLKSLKLNRQFDNHAEVLEGSILLTKLYNEVQRYEQTIQTGLQYLPLAISISNFEQIDRLVGTITEAYIELGEFKSAIDMQEAYAFAKDSIENQRIKNIIFMTQVRASLENDMIFLKQQDEIKAQTIRAQNILLISAIAGMILLMLIAVIIYRALVINKRLTAINKAQAERLRQLDQAKSRFFANISHDLRTPTSLIIGSIDQVLNNQDVYLNNKAERQLKTGLQNGQRIIHLTNEINELIQLEDGQLRIHRSYVNLDKMLSLFVLMFTSMTEMKGIKLSYSKSIFEEKPIVSVDTQQFERVLFNLITNAVKHTKKNDFITLSLQKENETLILSVIDSGEGIPEENLPYLFERYYQADKNTFKTQEGFGIGLAFVKEILDKHGYPISVKSKLGEGTQFEIRLKLETVADDLIVNEHTFEYSEKIRELFKDIDDVETGNKPIVRFETRNEQGEINETTILIVEDHPEVRQYIQDIIEPYYSIILAGNGQKALEVLRKRKVDIIITDLMMPWFDGFELLEKLKESEKFSQIPVLVISARTSEEDKLNVLNLGISDFLHKPFNTEELLARLKNMLKQKGSWSINNAQSIIAKSKVSLNELEKSQLKKVDKIILGRIDDPNLSVSDLSNELSVSDRNCFRMIKKLANTTPYEYIKEIRLQYAYKLLLDKSYTSSSEVAESVGIRNVSHFNEQFRKRFGKKPADMF